MNARLYDPELGRFIQADDFVEPEATQGLNRYSYVLNNPLSATDPSGNFSLRQALGIVVGVVAAIVSGQLWALNNLWASFATAVAGGFASAAIATGSLKAGLWGAISAAAFWGIGTHFSSLQAAPKPGSGNLVEAVFKRVASGNAVAKIAAHAVTGGTLSALQGGKFGHGFVAAGFTEALSPAVGQIKGRGFAPVLSRTAINAAVGGTASKLAGGSFANGATTGAFQELFNSTVHDFLVPGPDWQGGSGQSEHPLMMNNGFEGTTHCISPCAMSTEGIDALMGMEGSRNRLYNDSNNHATIGVGHLVHLGPIDGRASEFPFINGITNEQIRAIFVIDVAEFEGLVTASISRPATQYQFDALVAFSFRLGSGRFPTSGVVDSFNRGDITGASAAFMNWTDRGRNMVRPTWEQQIFDGRGYNRPW
jgi:GH24 family phage-related lysozyme (muramidase)